MDAGTTTRGTALGVALAWGVTTAVYVLGNAGAPIRVVTGWAPDGAELGIAEYVLTSAFAVTAGGMLLWAMERMMAGGHRNALRAWTAMVAVVAVGSSVPLWGLDVDRGSKLCLTLMHLGTGLAAVAGQRFARNRASVRSHAMADASAS